MGSTAARVARGEAPPEAGGGARREVLVAHFRDGRSAARAISDLAERGFPTDGVYVVASGEAGLLTRLGVTAADAGRAAAERAAVVVAVAVGCDRSADCLAVLGERAEVVGVPAAA
jgi:hypothetical protein